METATLKPGARVRVYLDDDPDQRDGEYRVGTVTSTDEHMVWVQADRIPNPMGFSWPRIEVEPEQVTIALSFTAPPDAAPTLRREVELLLGHLEPVQAWLERQGGEVAVTGMEASA
ncbi:hypothetical protein [Nocardia sp. NPDC057227]|uniref:hypothetical protein n=1 Tax=Nocardia sp. NPDC057227 TaxID=3346056 RepID=UPI00362646D5